MAIDRTEDGTTSCIGSTAPHVSDLVGDQGYGTGVSITSVPGEVLRWLDRAQARHWWLAHPIGVVKKFGDDRSGALAGVVTYQLFFGMLPLLVVVLTIFGTILQGSSDLRDAVVDSTLRQLPVIGERLENDLSALTVTGPWVAVSVAALFWRATGIYNSLQYALNQVWGVPSVHRQSFIGRLLRAVLLFVLLLVAAVGSAILRQEALTPVGGFWGELAKLGGSTIVTIAVLVGAFRLVLSAQVETWQIVPAAVLSGLLWQLLQRLGETIVMRELTRAEDLYGGLATVIVVLLWLNLLARAAIFANEWAVVSLCGLWPRRIMQPPLSEADRDVLEVLVRNERRRPEQHVAVWFDHDSSEPAPTVDVGGRQTGA